MNIPLLALNAPTEVRLFDGRRVRVDPYGKTGVDSDVGTRTFDLSWRTKQLDWHESLASILIGLLSTHAVDYAGSCSMYCGAFVDYLGSRPEGMPSRLDLEHLADFPEHRPISTWPFVQAVLKRWVSRGLPGLDPKIGQFLSQPEKWEERRNGHYFALVANDPERGALTEQELRNVYDALNRAYASSKISTAEWALASFLFGTGVRPVQIARAKKGDVIETSGPEGRELTLLITIAKTRQSKKTARWRRKCPTQLAEIMLKYLATPQMELATDEAHLFQSSSRQVTQALHSIFDRLDTHSDRLNGPIPLFPYRFRYTLGTRAIAFGARDEEVARLLTHTSLHCVQYYRAALPSLQKPIQDAIGPEMTVFARAFQGRLIESLSDATRKDDQAALITAYEHLNGEDLGACGTRAKCYQDAPRSCLTCDKFEPFKEAPWENLRGILVADRASETEERIRSITQDQIDAVDGIIAERDASAMSALV